MKKPVVLGITVGDVGGIGPEVALKATGSIRWPRHLCFVLIGSAPIIGLDARRLGMACPPMWQPGSGLPSARTSIFDPGVSPRLKRVYGRVSIPAARAAAGWIRAGVGECLAGRLSGIVTAPINKEGFERAGVGYAGHTEMLADLTGTSDFAMMLMGGPLRVVLVTRHIPVRDIARSIDGQKIILAARLASQALDWLGCKRKTIGVCGLNPHAGDGGAIGLEENEIIAPAIRVLRRRGIDVEGPIAGDTAFHSAVCGRYGAILAMYHDQGLAPLKTIAFESGVNLTLGLPIVRTSPDHGTAFDIAGKGVADARSMIEAIKLADRLAGRVNPWKAGS